jgi:hypothetical protein
MEGTVPTNE